MQKKSSLAQEILMLALVFLMCLSFLLLSVVSDTDLKHFIYIFAGVLISEFRQVCKFYFGGKE